MSQNIKTDIVSFLPRATPWHELGAIVEDASDSATAISLAGLDWEVHQTPARYFNGMEERIIDSLYVNYRADTGEPLGVVSDRYTVVQNQTVFEFTDRLLGAGLQYGMAGELQGGCRIWLQAYLPEKKILDDSFSQNLLFFNGHDGKSPVQVYMTPVRMTCANMLNLAMMQTTRKWHLPHVSTIHGKMIDAGRTLKQANAYMDELNWRAETLATAKLMKNDLRRFVEKMFPGKDTERKNNRIKQEIERFHDCYTVADLENFKGTKWGLLLAVSDYVTHKPMRTNRQRERHFSRMMEGHELLDRAYSLIDTM